MSYDLTPEQIANMSEQKLNSADDNIAYLKTYIESAKKAWPRLRKTFYEMDYDNSFYGILLYAGKTRLWFNPKDSKCYSTEGDGSIKYPPRLLTWYEVVDGYDTKQCVRNLIDAITSLPDRVNKVDPELVKAMQVVSASKA